MVVVIATPAIVNVPDAEQEAVIDRVKQAVDAKWLVKDANHPRRIWA
jgi:hypothetical protein